MHIIGDVCGGVDKASSTVSRLSNQTYPVSMALNQMSMRKEQDGIGCYVRARSVQDNRQQGHENSENRKIIIATFPRPYL